MVRVVAIVVCAVLAVGASADLPSYTGSLSSANGEILGTGFWVNQGALPPAEQPNWVPVVFGWTVSQNANLSWHYKYDLQVYRAEVSHLIIETSPGFTAGDLWDETGPFERIVVGTHNASGSGQPNPFMPSNVYGIKFDDTSGTTLTLEFDSSRSPIWGDFYSKCGNVGGTQNTAWNQGFGNPDVDPDIALYPVDDGSVLNHVLIPDTQSDYPIPEPGTLALLGLGLAGLGSRLRRRR